MNIYIRRVRLVLISVLPAVLMILLSSASSAQAQACPTPVNLVIGQYGYVSPVGPPNVLRAAPGLNSGIISQLAGGTSFRVFNGPRCHDGYNWWHVETYDAPILNGWTADGDFTRAWLVPQAAATCHNSPPSRLLLGMQARVTPGEPNIIREFPGAGARLGSIPAGGVIDIFNGPECDSVGRLWWYVNYMGVVGWTSEGENSVYWLEPHAGMPTPTPAPVTGCTLAPRLRVGTTGMVTPGDPNVLRDVPGLNRSGSTVIGNLTQGAIFTVLNGPTCRDGYNWWQVTAGGRVGWTAEGENGVYWLDPLVCANGMTSRVAPGMWARVTPGPSNRLRSAPSTEHGGVIGQIPAGHHVRVLNAFQCDPQGRMWWLVAQGWRIGWTAEGENGNYWLEPA
jgi:hypothetical protein